MKRFLLVVLLVVFFIPGFALADAAAPAAPQSVGQVLLGFLSPSTIASGVVAVLGLIAGFSFLTARRKKALATAAYYAFHITEDAYDQLDDGPVKDAFNKVQSALKSVDAYLVANGWRPMKPGEAPAATLALQALHGAEVAKSKVLIAAAEATAPGPQ